jgi:hypothetical protein
MRVAVLVCVIVLFPRLGRRRETDSQPEMPMGATLRVRVLEASMTMALNGGGHDDAG